MGRFQSAFALSLGLHILAIGVLCLTWSKHLKPHGSSGVLIEVGTGTKGGSPAKQQRPSVTPHSGTAKEPAVRSESLKNTTQGSVIQNSAQALGPSEGGQELLGGGDVSSGTIREQYLSELRQFLNQNKFYPAVSRRLGQTGVVEVSFAIREDGQFESVKIIKECSFSKLNEATRELFDRVKGFRPPPSELNGQKLSFVIEIEYVLRN